MARIDSTQIKEIFSKNLSALLEDRSMNPSDLARHIGMEKQSVYAWIKCKTFPSADNLQEVVNALDVKLDDLLSPRHGFAFSESSCAQTYDSVVSRAVAPIVGDVAAGDTCEAIQMYDGELTVPESIKQKHPKARFLRVSGESMNKLFQHGEYVLYDPELPVNDGDVAVVYVNGDEATIKRIFFAGDTVVLHPESSMEGFYDRPIDTRDPSSPSVGFAGRVIWATLGDKEMRF